MLEDTDRRRRRPARAARWLAVALAASLPLACDDVHDPAAHEGELHQTDQHHAEGHDEHHDEVHGDHPVEAHDTEHAEHHDEGHADPHAGHTADEAHHGEAHHGDEHGAHHEGGGSARSLGRAEGPAGDAVRAEMQALHAATQAMMTDIVDGRLDALSSRLGPVHETRRATVAAIEAHGYAPPGAPDDLAGFEAADDAFHDSLVGLLNASRADDLSEATRQLGVVLSGCTSCHQQYRFVERP